MNERFLSFGQEKKLKMILVGDSNVGKTALFWKYINGQFLQSKQNQTTTITIDFKIKNVKFKDETVKIYIWDTAGQQKYRSIISTYFKGCHGILMMFDQTNPQSFDHLVSKWHPLCLSKAEQAKMVLIGNKIDLQRNVNREQVLSWSQKNKIKYFQTSVKDQVNIQTPFMALIQQIFCYKLQKNHTSPKIFQKSSSFSVNRKKECQSDFSNLKNCC